MKRSKSKRSQQRTRATGTSLENPPTGYTMSVLQLAQLTQSDRNAAYRAVQQGVYPSIRQGRSIKVLVVPTLQILRGEREPGQPKI